MKLRIARFVELDADSDAPIGDFIFDWDRRELFRLDHDGHSHHVDARILAEGVDITKRERVDVAHDHYFYGPKRETP